MATRRKKLIPDGTHLINRSRWIRALRNKQYAQTTGSLRRDKPRGDIKESFCCLGVASEISQYYQNGTCLKATEKNPVTAIFEASPKTKDLPAYKGHKETVKSGYVYSYKHPLNKNLMVNSHNIGIPPTEWFAHEFGVTSEQAEMIINNLASLNDNTSVDFTFKHIAEVVDLLFRIADKENSSR